MCGIAGIFHRRDTGLHDIAALRSMTRLLAHRGPDDAGHLALDTRSGRYMMDPDPGWAGGADLLLGNRRLSVVDLSAAGRQPMVNEADDLFLVFNGEIYNHPDLRLDLESRGHRFRSRSDTEVVLRAYEEWGAGCVQRFNGMWALAVWDQRNQCLFCSRDRFGIKPFYYILTRDTFAFASEAKALLPLLQGRREPNHRLIHEFFSGRRFEDPTETFFQGVFKLAPAHTLTVGSNRETMTRYWDLEPTPDFAPHPNPWKRFRELLCDAVRLRTQHSDVPVGLALSGGLDSTAVLSCMAGVRPQEELHAFTSVFPGFSRDESRFALAAAESFGARLNRVHYRPDTLVDDLRRIIWHLDYPSVQYQVIPRWRLMQQAATRLTVILEGQGGDELLAGYTALHLGYYLKAEAGTPLGWWRSLQAMAAIVWDTPLQSLYLTACLHCPALSRRYHRRMLEGQPLAKGFKRSYPPKVIPRIAARFGDPLTDRLYHDLTLGIIPHLLRFGDAISMAHGLESRVPFLDHRLVEFVFGLPYRFKMDRGQSKPLLRRAFADTIPKLILQRRDKVGFYAPLGAWLQEHLESISSLLLDPVCLQRGLMDPPALEKLLEKVGRRPNRQDAHSLFKALSLEIWFQTFMDRTSDMP